MKKISTILKYLYKSLVRIFFKLLYGKIIYGNQNSFDKDLIIDTVISKNILKPNNNNYHIYKIINGRIYTDYVENVAIIHKNKVLDKVSYQQVDGELKNSKFNSSIYKGTPYFKKKISGSVLCLTQGASGHNNYFHWLFDILPKIKIYSEKYDLNTLNYFYLSRLKEFQKSSLKILRLDNIKILDANKYRHISSNETFAVEHPWYFQGTVLEQAKNLPSWIVRWVRESFLESACEFDTNEKIFIDRSESKFDHCQLQNNDEITSFLINKGFTPYKTGQLTFEQQIYLFKKAKVIVGAHGAAFANLAFCSPKTKVIEIKPLDHPNYVSKTIGSINDLNLEIIETPKINIKSNIKGDIYLSLKKLEKYL